jgi:hypothetical protein
MNNFNELWNEKRINDGNELLFHVGLMAKHKSKWT